MRINYVICLACVFALADEADASGSRNATTCFLYSARSNHQTELLQQKATTSQIDWNSFLAQHDMYWTSLTADPVERSADNRLRTGYYAGAIMGNGLLGTNLYKLTDNVYRLNIGRSDVTEARKPYNLFNSARLPIGYFTLKTCGNVSSEEMRLSIYDAVTQGTLITDKGRIQFRTYVHANENVVSFETDAQGGEVGLLSEAKLRRKLQQRLLPLLRRRRLYESPFRRPASGKCPQDHRFQPLHSALQPLSDTQQRPRSPHRHHQSAIDDGKYQKGTLQGDSASLL